LYHVVLACALALPRALLLAFAPRDRSRMAETRNAARWRSHKSAATPQAAGAQHQYKKENRSAVKLLIATV
jgi:hypothetical protein